MTYSSMSRLLLCKLTLCATLVGCSNGSNNHDSFTEPEYLPVPNPVVSAPPDMGEISLLAENFSLEDVGYQQSEYFLEGTAYAYTNLSELAADGVWAVEPGEEAQYKTRIVVKRPIDPSDFSGNVLVEWLNVTAGFETPPSWGTGQLEMRRGGAAWIGVSAQLVGIEGNPAGGLPLPLYLKAVDPERYGSLMHPGDSFSYDIFSQVAQAVRNPEGIDPLGELEVERLIAYGESQSAGRLVTYVNAIHPLYNTYDAYMIHSRGDGSPPLAQDPQVEIETPAATKIRTDLNVPVMTFETETDVLLLGYAAARQPDTELIRTWEVAATAHGDYYTFISGRDDTVGEPVFASIVEETSIFGFINCEKPMNNGPQHYVFNTAVRALNSWVAGGNPPPTSPRLALNSDESDYQYDDLGNVLGGIRTPYSDAPSAVLLGEANPGASFCFLFGTTSLFDAAQMASLYVDEAGFTAAVTEATESAVAAGFLLQEDANAIIEWAPQQWRSQSQL
jgi:hypothetical protein